MELLAPAKNIDVARAAIMAGTDAVYIGAPRFGARQAAGNSIKDVRVNIQPTNVSSYRQVTLEQLMKGF